MPGNGATDDMRDDLEHQRALRMARHRVSADLAQIAQLASGHAITVERFPGRRDRYVAKARTPAATPYLLVTDDLNELFIELISPATSPPGQPR